MITWAKIKNFKCFGKLEVSRLGQITLVGGKNNVGKTALLEALVFAASRGDRNLVPQLYATRGIKSMSGDPDQLWAPLFREFDTSRPIVIEVGLDKVRNVTIAAVDRDFTPPPAGPGAGATDVTGSDQPVNVRTDRELPATTALRVVLKQSTGEQSIGSAVCYHYLDRGEVRTYEASQLKPGNARLRGGYLSARMFSSGPWQVEAFDALVARNRELELLEIAGLIEPRLKSLQKIKLGGTDVIHGDVGLARKLPVSLMGGGIDRLLSIAIGILQNENGVLLIDEIDNGIHHSALPDVWSALAQASEKHKCQIIATTHSYECLLAAREGIPESMREGFQYVRLERRGGEEQEEPRIVAVSVPYDAFASAIEQRLEVR